VDDGSTDESGRICDEYLEIDSRIIVLHKQNGGLSDARNAGVEKSSGQYIAFFDSDDILSPFFIEIMMKAMEEGECDIVALSGGTDFWDGDEEPQLAADINDYKVEFLPAKRSLERMLYQQIATGAPFKIIKKELFNGISFPVGYLYEDVATTYKFFLKAKNTAIITSRLYAYRKRKNSIIRQGFNDKKMIAMTIFDQLVTDEELKAIGLYKAAVSRVYAMLFSVFLQIPYDRKTELVRAWSKLKSYRSIVMFDKTKLMRNKNRYAAWISLLGMKLSYKIGRRFGQKGSMN
jgi:glycosyltransferase involved in cell wall biosynthesis